MQNDLKISIGTRYTTACTYILCLYDDRVNCSLVQGWSTATTARGTFCSQLSLQDALVFEMLDEPRKWPESRLCYTVTRCLLGCDQAMSYLHRTCSNYYKADIRISACIWPADSQQRLTITKRKIVAVQCSYHTSCTLCIAIIIDQRGHLQQHLLHRHSFLIR